MATFTAQKGAWMNWKTRVEIFAMLSAPTWPKIWLELMDVVDASPATVLNWDSILSGLGPAFFALIFGPRIFNRIANQ